MLLARDENGSDHYFMLELLGAELTDHKTGKKVPYIGFSEVRVKEFTNAPGNKKFQTFEWAGYHWTKQLIGNPLGEEYSATELKSIIQEYAREMPDYDTTRKEFDEDWAFLYLPPATVPE
ncbi:uncharacterized protein A1O5_03020 [Cladophialophora psammophila CBS 110553]|uniref:Uncharacterized protein n=1 Tax=Cladophialophora psammophila CBS 110553 TaxID=1182543 RepID=W9X7E0_9EURO|nr:uncharacterized protein A1O5_03020 [Cladophialophora psammophila CBS 110553]EXJ73260.1 hypothetical protein A1O5_03020 [Cladophialophora psammophila CBS 110553]